MTIELSEREKRILDEFPALLKEVPSAHASKQLSAIFHSWLKSPAAYEVYEAAMLAHTRNWASDFLKQHLTEYLQILMKASGQDEHMIREELTRIQNSKEEPVDFTGEK